METTIDISLYPLKETYRDSIIDFVQRLKAHSSIRVETNGMSTQVFGPYDTAMQCIQEEMKHTLLEEKAVFVLKIASGSRTPESIPSVLK